MTRKDFKSYITEMVVYGASDSTRRPPRRIPIILVFALLAGLLVVATGCGGKKDRLDDDTAPVRVGHFPNLTHAPALLLRGRGEFEKAVAPRPVEWSLFTAGPSAIEALFAGEIDLVYVGPGPASTGFLRSGGTALAVVAGCTSGGAGLVVHRESGIVSPRELDGKRIATPQRGNTQDIMLRSLLLGLSLDSADRGGTVTVVAVPPAEQLALFEKKEIDGAWAVEPWLSRFLVEQKAGLLVDEAVLWPDGRYPTTVVVARRGFIDRQPELLGKMLEAHRGAVETLAAGDVTARVEVVETLAELTRASLSPDVVASAWKRLSFTVDPMEPAIAKGVERAEALGFLDPGSSNRLAGLVGTAPSGGSR